MKTNQSIPRIYGDIESFKYNRPRDIRISLIRHYTSTDESILLSFDAAKSPMSNIWCVKLDYLNSGHKRLFDVRISIARLCSVEFMMDSV